MSTDVVRMSIRDARSAGAVEGVRRAIRALVGDRECPMPAAEYIPARFAGGEPTASDGWPVAAHDYLDAVCAGIEAAIGTGDQGWVNRAPEVVSQFVSALTESEWIMTARDAADVLVDPHKWSREFAVWHVLGMPAPSDADEDGAEAWSVCTWAFGAVSGDVSTQEPLRLI